MSSDSRLEEQPNSNTSGRIVTSHKVSTRVVLKRGDDSDNVAKLGGGEGRQPESEPREISARAVPARLESAVDSIDDEDTAIVAGAEEEEQRTLVAVMSMNQLQPVSISRAQSAAPASTASGTKGITSSAKEVPHAPAWPEPLDEDPQYAYGTEAWPDLARGGHEVEQWVISRQRLLVRTVTWNLAARPPPPVEDVIRTLLPRNKYHVYVIGSEECERSIAQSALNPSKKGWESYLTQVLGDMYVPLRSHTLQAIHIIVFAHKDVAHLCTDIGSGAVATGFGGNLGNKGAVGIKMNIASTSFMIVNAHLSAHQNAVQERNDEFNRIVAEMPTLVKKSLQRSQSSQSLSSKVSPTPVVDANASIGAESHAHGASLENYADRVVFMGDLNYRIRGNRSMIDKLLSSNMHEVLLHNDQLKWAMKEKLICESFVEPPLNFRPTYKYDFLTTTYDTSSKARIPSWTDRIMHVERGVSCIAYNCDNSLRTSDHRPVYATFVLEVLFHPEHVATLPDSHARVTPQFSSESQVCSIM